MSLWPLACKLSVCISFRWFLPHPDAELYSSNTFKLGALWASSLFLHGSPPPFPILLADPTSRSLAFGSRLRRQPPLQASNPSDAVRGAAGAARCRRAPRAPQCRGHVLILLPHTGLEPRSPTATGRAPALPAGWRRRAPGGSAAAGSRPRVFPRRARAQLEARRRGGVARGREKCPPRSRTVPGVAPAPAARHRRREPVCELVALAEPAGPSAFSGPRSPGVRDPGPRSSGLETGSVRVHGTSRFLPPGPPAWVPVRVASRPCLRLCKDLPDALIRSQTNPSEAQQGPVAARRPFPPSRGRTNGPTRRAAGASGRGAASAFPPWALGAPPTDGSCAGDEPAGLEQSLKCPR